MAYLGNGRHIGQLRQALCGADGNGAQLAGANVRNKRGQPGRTGLGAAGQQVGTPFCLSYINAYTWLPEVQRAVARKLVCEEVFEGAARWMRFAGGKRRGTERGPNLRSGHAPQPA